MICERRLTEQLFHLIPATQALAGGYEHKPSCTGLDHQADAPKRLWKAILLRSWCALSLGFNAGQGTEHLLFQL
jgi:hypothetical protein